MTFRKYTAGGFSIVGVVLTVLLLMAPTGGFPSRPIFQTVRTTGTLTDLAGSLELQSIRPGMYYDETDAAANERLWRFSASGGNFELETRTDIDGAGASAFVANRTGTALSNVALSAGAHTLDITTSRAALTGTAPRFFLNETDGGADEDIWTTNSLSGLLCLDTRTDADGAGNSALCFDRTGTTIGTITFAPVVDIIGRGIETMRVKSADTARSSTIVLSNDPHMVYAVPTAGTYNFRVYMQVDGTTTGTQGIGINVNYSGTFTSPGSHWMGFRHCVAAVQTGGGVVAAAVTTLQQTCADVNTTDSDNAITMEGTLIATGAGNLGVAWAQEASSANATNVREGSYLSVTRIL